MDKQQSGKYHLRWCPSAADFAIDIVTQEIQPVDPSAQLISVASLLYGLDAQIGDQAREAPAVEDRGPNAVETSMQTDSPRNDVSDGQLEREDRDDSPSI